MMILKQLGFICAPVSKQPASAWANLMKYVATHPGVNLSKLEEAVLAHCRGI